MPAVLEHFDPGIEWTAPRGVAPDSPYRGPDAVGAFFAGLQTVWQEIHVEPQELLDLGDGRVLALGRHRGRGADGSAVEVPFAHVWTTSGGRVTRFVEYADPTELLAAARIAEAAHA